jgi:hypothetical protein
VKFVLVLLMALGLFYAPDCLAGDVGSIHIGAITKIPGSDGYSLQGWNAAGTGVRALQTGTNDYVEFDAATGAKTVLIAGTRLANFQWFGISKDGQTVFYVREGEDGLYVMNADGSQARKIWNAEFTDLAVTADGSRAFLVVRNSQILTAGGVALPTDIVAIRVQDGTVLTRFTLTLGTDQDGDPIGPSGLCLSPDGSRIALDGGVVNAGGDGFVAVDGLFPMTWSQNGQYVISEGGCVFTGSGAELLCRAWSNAAGTADLTYLFLLNLEMNDQESEFIGSVLSVVDKTDGTARTLVDLKSAAGIVADDLALSPDSATLALGSSSGIHLMPLTY